MYYKDFHSDLLDGPVGSWSYCKALKLLGVFSVRVCKGADNLASA